MKRHDTSEPRAQAGNNPETFKERDDWMRAVLAAADLPSAARCLAIAIALHLNVKTGQCNPGHKRLADDIGKSTRSVERFLAVLERAGRLTIKRGGRGQNNNYVLVWPPTRWRIKQSRAANLRRIKKALIRQFRTT
jgi:hypothetical protein